MNKSALQDIQQALNAIRSEIERVDDETKWAALELMLGTSSSVVALAKKMAKPETKTVTRTVAVPKTKIVTQQPQQQMVEAKQNERASALKKVKRLCKEFGFTAGMLKGALAKGRKNNV